MNKLNVLIFIVFFIGCNSDDNVIKVIEPEEPEQLVFPHNRFEIDHNITDILSAGNSSSWYVSMVSEIIDTDTTNYFFNEGKEVKGDWFTIAKDANILNANIKKNKLWGERYLNVKVESKYSKGTEISIKQHPDSKYVESDEDLTKSLIGVWLLTATFNGSMGNRWDDVEKDTVVEFLADGTYRQYYSYPDSYSEDISYKINEKNFFFRYNILDSYDYTVTGCVYTYKYSFYDDMFKAELIWGLYDNNTPLGYIYKRIYE